MLKVGVFGVGHLGKFHLNNWKEIKKAELVGFYDPDDEIAWEVANKYQLTRFSDPTQLMDVCDVVDIVAPTPAHFSLCEKAIRKGKHVFVEKPLANTMAEARELMKLVRESNVKLQVGHVERFNPAFLAVQSMPLNPLFIEVALYLIMPLAIRGSGVSRTRSAAARRVIGVRRCRCRSSTARSIALMLAAASIAATRG